jgi:cobalt/nickel transport protein
VKTAEENSAKNVPWFDPFTRWMLTIMFAVLAAIFIVAKYMDMHNMAGGGTDDMVNQMASLASHVKSHPFIELPGDAEVGAFSVANFFAGMIVGHNWKRLFEEPPR